MIRAIRHLSNIQSLAGKSSDQFNPSRKGFFMYKPDKPAKIARTVGRAAGNIVGRSGRNELRPVNGYVFPAHLITSISRGLLCVGSFFMGRWRKINASQGTGEAGVSVRFRQYLGIRCHCGSTTLAFAGTKSCLLAWGKQIVMSTDRFWRGGCGLFSMQPRLCVELVERVRMLALILQASRGLLCVGSFFMEVV